LLPARDTSQGPRPLISAREIWCGYDGTPVLKGFSFSMEEGDFLGVLGPNGSGKSTLVLALSGVLPLERGQIEMGGEPIERLRPRERARRVAVVAQSAGVGLPFSCLDVVHMGRYPHQRRWQMESLRDAEVVDRVLRLTDTAGLADRLMTAISGGERQRVIMAKALAQESPLLLLDEATSAMDVHRKLQIFRVLERLNGEEGLTVLAVLHDINLAALFCRRLLFIKDGRVVAEGLTETVLTAEILEEVYETPVLVQAIPGTDKRQVVFLP